jgi:acetylornithine deacetylase/succinyl-diaminopimelate desuccinylase-like protein
VKLLPTMSCGADDSRFLRAVGMRAYGFHPVPMSDADGRRAHGIDERIPAGGLRTGVELFYRLVLALNPAAS